MPRQKISSNCADVYAKTAEQLNIDESVVRAVIYNMWAALKSNIRKGKSHGYLIHNFGTFEVFHSVLNNEIKELLKKYRNAKDKYQHIPSHRKKFETDFRTLWALRQDAMMTKKDRRMKSTYR